MAIRSFLYAPGHLPERLEEAFAHGADAVVYDLEDGVPAELRDEARANVVEALGGGRRGCESPARPTWRRSPGSR